MESIGQTCAARSLGPANYLVTTLISSLVSMHCNTSPLDMWPPDQGEEAVKNGEVFPYFEPTSFDKLDSD